MKKKVNTYSLAGCNTAEIRKAVDIHSLPDGNYNVFIDLTNGEVNMAKASTAKSSELIIGKVRFTTKDLEQSEYDKYIIKFSKEIFKIWRDYSGRICKTTAIKEFGKKFMNNFEPLCCIENPYYHCSNAMEIFDRNMLEYYKQHPELTKGK